MSEAPEPEEPAATHHVGQVSGGISVQGRFNNLVVNQVSWQIVIIMIAVLAVVAVVVVWATRKQPAAAAPSSGRPPTTTTAPPANQLPQFGDLRSADPCSLIDPTTVSKYGHFEESNDYGEFNRCDLVDSSTNADLKLVLDLGSQDVVPDIEIQDGDGPDGDDCDRIIPLSDKRQITLTAAHLPIDRMCEIAQAFATGTAKILRALGGRQISRRDPLPQASLATSKACDLLDDAAVAQLLGFNVGPKEGFGDWSCQWSGAGATTVKIQFERNTMRQIIGQPSTFFNRTGYLDTDDPCLVHLVYRTYLDDQQNPTEDLVDVRVADDQSANQPCGPTRALATVVAQRLR